MADLFAPLRLGALDLPNRIVMAPMTRSRADTHGVPQEIVAEYYAQRASAGLIVTEAIYVSAMAKGYVRTPGLVTPEQVAAWKKVTQAVHGKGGRIFAQLYHTGRVALPDWLPGGVAPVAPSAIAINGTNQTDEGKKPFVMPRALETDEIAGVAAEYGQAAQRAMEAGFDGVEVHGASGYLIHQFLDATINTRTDRYGGSAANRVRFLREAVESVVAVVGKDRVGVKISPRIKFNDVVEPDAEEVYPVVARELSECGIAYLHGARQGAYEVHNLRALFSGAYLAGSGFDFEKANDAIVSGAADAVVFGKPFLANPDLPRRYREGLDLAQPDQGTIYWGGAKGYVDYPAHM
ncbi:MAG: alkene reductase [Rhizobiales bacterium 62-17]|nr:alkene reductase [Hyphomicrobiales bacterium]OJY01843.1 MAG: alkene reductase [Rhizobiales bacterium 62-17]